MATQEGPSRRIAMLPVPGKSSGNYGWTTFLLQRSVLERHSPLSASPKRGQRRCCATDLGADARQGGLKDVGYVAYCALRSMLVSAGAAAAHSSQKKHAVAGWVLSAIHSIADQGSVVKQVSV